MDKEKICGIICAMLIFLLIALPIVGYLFICMPADTTYNRKFRSHTVMAKDQATFEGMEEQIKVLWEEMNKTFAGEDFNATYNTWWPPDKTYDNSLCAQRDYFQQILKSIDRYQGMYEKLLNNSTNPTMLEDWYYKSISNLRNEMNREGGLDWALKNAWYLNKAPSAYWFLYWMIPLEIIIGIFAVLSWVIWKD